MGDQTAAEIPFTHAGNVAATMNVRDATEELDSEKEPADDMIERVLIVLLSILTTA